MLHRLPAYVLIGLVLSPFTAPFATCDLAVVCGIAHSAQVPARRATSPLRQSNTAAVSSSQLRSSDRGIGRRLTLTPGPVIVAVRVAHPGVARAIRDPRGNRSRSSTDILRL